MMEPGQMGVSVSLASLPNVVIYPDSFLWPAGEQSKAERMWVGICPFILKSHSEQES